MKILICRKNVLALKTLDTVSDLAGLEYINEVSGWGLAGLDYINEVSGRGFDTVI